MYTYPYIRIPTHAGGNLQGTYRMPLKDLVLESFIMLPLHCMLSVSYLHQEALYLHSKFTKSFNVLSATQLYDQSAA